MTQRNLKDNKVLFDPNDAILLMIDHQSGLLQAVKDIPVEELRRNTSVLARLATVAKIPVLTTASVPEGPNGPLIPEIHELASHAVFVPRTGEINAWDNVQFVDAVIRSGRRTLLIAGVWTSICVALPAISAAAEGYNVYAIIDGSGNYSQRGTEIAISRMVQGGVKVTDTAAVVAEVQRTWNRGDAADFADLYATVAPNYRALIQSYEAAQAALK